MATVTLSGLGKVCPHLNVALIWPLVGGMGPPPPTCTSKARGFGAMTSPWKGLLWFVPLHGGSMALRALAWDRTPDEKGLRDRNSPMCTLSQNGYGDTLWSTKVLPTL